jgi:nucleotide-binding universal stress UspA family protein
MAVQQTRKETRAKLDRLCYRLEDQGIATRPHVCVGDVVAELEIAARDCQATMIITSASGRSSLQERLGGSVSMTLAEKSQLPLLIIPAPQ